VKRIVVACVLAACSSAWGQIPDIKVHFDATFSYVVRPNATPFVNFFDIMGRPSILALSFYTEQGFRVYVAEKLQHIPGDQSNDLFDEYYVEDEKIWRVGKQYLPFGSGRMLHESALAVRGDTNLIVEGLPVSFALCEAGQGLDSGVVGRLGSMIGLSVAYGQNFGTAGTSLTEVRRPEDAPGPGHGWKEAFGMDASRRIFDHWTVRAEGISFREGETTADKDTAVFDFSVSLDPKKGQSYTLAWSQIVPDRHDFWRLGGAFALSKNVSFEPMIRFRDGDLYDLTAEIRVRI